MKKGALLLRAIFSSLLYVQDPNLFSGPFTGGQDSSTRRYLKAILRENWRHNLKGEKVEEISQEHKDRATKDLAERKKKFQTAQMPHYKGVNA